MTADEAVKNVASLYNADTLTIGNLNVTKDLNVTNKTSTNDLNVTNKTSTNDLNVANKIISKDLEITGEAKFKGIEGTGPTQFPGGDGKNYITGKENILRGGATVINGDLIVTGKIYPKDEIVIDKEKWIRFNTANGSYSRLYAGLPNSANEGYWSSFHGYDVNGKWHTQHFKY
jgi:hypothetical protein